MSLQAFSKINLKRLAHAEQKKYPDLKSGEAYWATAMRYWPEIAERFRGQVVDPQMDDARINDFIEAMYLAAAKSTQTFQLIFSQIHRMWAIEKEDCSHEEHWYLRQALQANRYDDPFYKAAGPAHPFFQGGAEKKKGFALIEFWVSPDEEGRKKAQAYVDFLNENYQKTVEQAKEHGTLEWDLQKD